ncbi:MAG: hypothetical protein KJ052_13835 [Candidatus Hydrogenedentes bacterium]|nr:hypothetical protein [Candidatus Hydrogenedentota bacterium]
MRHWISLFAAALLCSPLGLAVESGIDDDGMLLIDGERAFVLGVYQAPGGDAGYEEAAEAGFNLLHCSDADSLDKIHAMGAYGWINTGYAIDLSTDRDNREATLVKLVDSVGGHPAFLVWEVPDEALWNTWYGPLTYQLGPEPAAQLDYVAKMTEITPEHFAALGEDAPGTDANVWRDELTNLVTKRQREARSLSLNGDLAGWEKGMDAIWTALGAPVPGPEKRITHSAERAEVMAGGMREGYDYLRKLDHHPVWMNHAPRNTVPQLAEFNKAADIVGCDIYPVPFEGTGHSDLAERTLTAVGAYTDRMQEAAPGKPVWMVLQGFGWADLNKDATPEEIEKERRPTMAETRFMAYDAIVNGARGILYWGSAYIEQDSQLWKDLLALGRELNRLAPILSAKDFAPAPQVEIAEQWGSLDRGIQVLAKEHQGKVCYIVVNEWTGSLQYRLSGLTGAASGKYRNVIDDTIVTVTDGAIATTIAAHGVQVFVPEQ